jgi:hypothetical protein
VAVVVGLCDRALGVNPSDRVAVDEGGGIACGVHAAGGASVTAKAVGDGDAIGVDITGLAAFGVIVGSRVVAVGVGRADDAFEQVVLLGGAVASCVSHAFTQAGAVVGIAHAALVCDSLGFSDLGEPPQCVVLHLALHASRVGLLGDITEWVDLRVWTRCALTQYSTGLRLQEPIAPPASVLLHRSTVKTTLQPVSNKTYTIKASGSTPSRSTAVTENCGAIPRLFANDTALATTKLRASASVISLHRCS